MKFNRCVRCGAFFASDDDVCPNCKSKDEIDRNTIKKYIANNDIPKSAEELSMQAGVSLKNLNRIISTNEFSSLRKQFSINATHNIINSINSSNSTKIKL